jgi:DNA-binding transcriptional LysR family regulator
MDLAMREPDWSHYQAFLNVIEAGGLTRAAKSSGLSQPTLSRQIAALESALGVPLFVRAGRGLKPTPAAARVADEARRMRSAASAILGVAGRETREQGGTVRISASEIVACFALPPLLARMAKTHPQIQIELEAKNDVANLLEREADIAIRMTKPKQSGLIGRRMPDVATGFYVSKSLLSRMGPVRSIGDLLRLRLIGYDKSDLIVAGARRAKIALKRDNFAFRCDHQVACWQMAREGLGVSMVARFVGDADPAMTRILPSFPMTPMQMWLVARKDIKSMPRLRIVFDALAEGLRRL